MKVVIAPDSFKGSLSALEVAAAIKKGVKNVNTEIETVLVPMADGGEGTVQSLVDATKGEIIELTVHDPLFREINSFYGIMGDGSTAVIEMAAASGLPLLSKDERNPLKTTTFGTGELISDALNKGCRNFIIGLGGSATNDGGCGMAKALGALFLDVNGNEIETNGAALSNLHSIDLSNLDHRINDSTFTVACDVDNPLCGEKGASIVYGGQKGASETDKIILDKNLAHFAEVVKSTLNVDIKDKPGSGAAGGLGAGVLVFLNAKLKKGIDIITKVTGLSEIMKDANLVITGEGRIDYQSSFGKTPFGVAQIAKQNNVPVIAINGSLGDNYQSLYNKGFDGIFSIINKPMTLDEAITNASTLITESTENIIRFWKPKK